MKRIRMSFEQIPIFYHLLKWSLLVLPISIAVGSIVALFLWLLELAIEVRFGNPWLLFLLPLAGIFIYFLYRFAGGNSEAGNNLIMDEIHQPGGGVPARMAPLVLISTVITHLFGGSAGREGTAVQIGGSVAQFFARQFKLDSEDVKILLMTGISAGFGSVFGTPVAGAVFALEVLTLGVIRYQALLPCLMASVLADRVCSGWGILHTQYHIGKLTGSSGHFSFLHFNFYLLLVVIVAGILFGLTSLLFSELSHSIKNYSNRFIQKKWLIPVIGAAFIIGLTYLIGTRDYLSLGVSNPDVHSISILSCFHAGGATYFSWFWKILFTAITLGTGFKGGEVTPLFFIGAALGNSIAVLAGVPVDLLAGLGFIAVFAGATNTPIASTLMGIELFGGEFSLYFAIACFTAYYFSGHSGIYSSQRIASSKINAGGLSGETTVSEFRNKRIKNKR